MCGQDEERECGWIGMGESNIPFLRSKLVSAHLRVPARAGCTLSIRYTWKRQKGKGKGSGERPGFDLCCKIAGVTFVAFRKICSDLVGSNSLHIISGFFLIPSMFWEGKGYLVRGSS